MVISLKFKGKEHPVLYISRKLFTREKSYLVIEKEGLGLKWAVNSCYYLLGNSFSLMTDQKLLQWLNRMKETNP